MSCRDCLPQNGHYSSRQEYLDAIEVYAKAHPEFSYIPISNPTNYEESVVFIDSGGEKATQYFSCKFKEGKPEIVICGSLEEWSNHLSRLHDEYPNEPFLQCDDPQQLRFGFVCVSANTAYFVPITKITASSDPGVKHFLRDKECRKRLMEPQI